jgi:hypothetical protein
MIAGIRRPLRAAGTSAETPYAAAWGQRSGSRPDGPSEFGEVRLLELIGKAFAALWVAWLAAAVVAFLAYASGLLSLVAALAVGLTLAVIFMAIGLLTKE